MCHKKCLEHKTQVNATCDSSDPAHSSHKHFFEEKHCIQRSLARYCITSTVVGIYKPWA